MNRADLERWLSVVPTLDPNGNYCHTWCRQMEAGKWKEHLPGIVRYLEQAHADAREVFHNTIHISLDPIPARRIQPSYPHDMPMQAKKGFFGEALCGMFTESMDIIGGDNWVIPTFLFRLHREAEEHLFRLVMKEKVPKKIPGRTGSDFLAIAFGADGKIQKFLSGEAKCHEKFNITKCKKFLKDISEEGPVPVSLPQLIRILEDQDRGHLTELIAAIDEIFLNGTYSEIGKINVLLYLYDNPKIASYETARISSEIKESSYNSNVPLHVFEICIPDGSDLVKTAYEQLYMETATDVAV